MHVLAMRRGFDSSCRHQEFLDDDEGLAGAEPFLLAPRDQFARARQSARSSPYSDVSETSPSTIQRSRRCPSLTKPSRSRLFAEDVLRGSISASIRLRSSAPKP